MVRLLKFQYLPAILLLSLVPFVVSGCASGSSTEPGDNNPRAVTATGTVKPAGITSFQYGSHLLYDSSGRLTHALASDEVDLGKWENRRVRLSGILKEGYPVDNGPPYVTVLSIQPMDGEESGE